MMYESQHGKYLTGYVPPNVLKVRSMTFTICLYIFLAKVQVVVERCESVVAT